MTAKNTRKSALLGILLIAGCNSLIAAQDGYLAGLRNWWNSENCRSRKEGMEILAAETADALKRNPRTALATGLGTGVMVAGAPITGGIMAATALALNNGDTTQAAFNRVIESADNGRTQLNAELRETLHTGLVDFQNIGTSVTQQIGLSADRAIHALGTATNDITLQLGESTSRIVATAGQSIQGNIAQLGETGRHVVNALNNTTQNIGTETRRSTQFFFRTLCQTLGFGSLGVAGAALFYKHIMNHTGEKSTIFASIGGGITLASIILSKLMFDRDLAVENAHAQEQAALRAADASAAQTQAQALRDSITAQHAARSLEAIEARARKLAQQKPVIDPAITRVCNHAQTVAEQAEKLATSLKLKSTIKIEEREATLHHIAHSFQTAREKLQLTHRQFVERIERETAQRRERFATMLTQANDTERPVIERTLAQEELTAQQTSEYNRQMITQQIEQLDAAEQATNRKPNPAASTDAPARSCD